DFRKFIPHIQLRDHEPCDAVNHACVAEKWQIEPAAATRAASDSAIFVSAGAQQVTIWTLNFTWKRPATHSRAIRLGHANHQVNRRGRHAGPCNRTARSSA